MQLPENPRLYRTILNLAGLATTVLVIGGFYSLIFRPLDRRQEEHLTRIHQLDRLLVQAASTGREYRAVRTELEELTQLVDELHGQLESGKSAAELLDELHLLASKHQLKVLDQQTGRPQKIATLRRTDIQLHCRGNYASICRFLAEAEELAKVVKLHTLEIDTRANLERYSVSMGFVFYSTHDSHDIEQRRSVL